MIRVAICDDEPQVLKELSDAVTDYAAQKKLDLSIDTFCSPEDLEKKTTEGKLYQIYILDMLMPHINGIEMGHTIRRLDRQAAIIYLTSTMDFAYQAYGVFAQRYLLKPVKEPQLYEAMDFAMENALRTQQTLYVKTAAGIHKIFIHEIEYAESASRAVHIFIQDGTEIVSRLLRKSFEREMETLLESPDFVQTHKSFIINLSYVRLFGPDQITMRSGALIPVSKSRQAAVKRVYLKYISENY